MPKKKANKWPGIETKNESTISRRSGLKVRAAVGIAGVAVLSMLTLIEAPDFRTTVDQMFCITPAKSQLLDAKPSFHMFHSDSSPTHLWGFNSQDPGPVCLQIYGNPSLARFRDSLQTSTITVDRNEITIHRYNGHHSSWSDVFASNSFQPRFFENNLHPDIHTAPYAFSCISDLGEKVGIRAELMPNTNAKNGMFLVFDEIDSGYAQLGETSLPPLWSGQRNVSFAEAEGGVMDRRELASREQHQAPSGVEPYTNADLCFYSFDYAMTSSGKLKKQTGSGGQFYGQNPV